VTALAAAGVYTSAWVRVRRQPIASGDTTHPLVHDRNRVRGAVVADQASAANGFEIHMANLDDQTDSYPAFQANLAANTVQVFDQQISAKYVRIELTNGAVAQGSLTLTAWLEDD